MAVTISYSSAAPFQKSNFQTNSYTGGSQLLPEVFALSNGGFVCAYANSDLPAEPFIKLNFYDAYFNPIGLHQPVNDSNVASQPSLTELADGNVLIVWENLSPDRPGLQARLFSPDGAGFFPSSIQLSPENLGNGPDEPQVAALADGGFIVSYRQNGDIYYGRYTAECALASPDLPRVNTASTGGKTDSHIAVLDDGGFIITFTDTTPADRTIRGVIYNSDGSVRKADFAIGLGGINSRSEVVALPNGNWAVVYQDTGWGGAEAGSTGITLQIFDPAGANVTPSGLIHVNTPSAVYESEPDVTVLENGFIVVTWTKQGPSGDVHARLFKPDGTPVTVDGSSDEFVLTGSAGGFSAVAGLPGGFITSWQDGVNSDGDGSQISSTIQLLTRISVGDSANDTIAGDAWQDAMNGGTGFDFASYAGAASGVTVRLYQPASNNGDAKGDSHVSIEGLIGSAFDDMLGGDFVNNILHGGGGDDTAEFAGNLGGYLVRDFGARIMVYGPNDGADTLTGIEHLKFADATLDVVDDGNALFDALFYLSQNPDVLQAGVYPLFHFNATGWKEGRDPNALFDTSGYLAVNKSVAAAGVNPLDHYHQVGWHEGRDPSANFDTTLYLINNPDVAAAGIDPLAHYLAAGFAEGRQAYAAVGPVSNGFDAQYYLFQNPDVAAAGIDPLAHYNGWGWHEGRDPNGWFDTSGYLSHNTDVAAAGINPLWHYETIGWTEGRDPSAGFDTLGYLAANPDVAAAGMNPLQHFLQFGIYEGRVAINDGQWF
jgi:hypothetical protein